MTEEDYYFPVDLQEVYETTEDGKTYIYDGMFTTSHPSYYEGGRTEHLITLKLTPNKGPLDQEHMYIEIDLDGKKVFSTVSNYIYVEPIEQVTTGVKYAVIVYISARYPEDYPENYADSLGDATIITNTAPTGDSPIRFMLSERIPPIKVVQVIDTNDK